MKELFKKWRGDEGRHMEGVHCAAELEAWLVSLWTEITEDPATWPPIDEFVKWSGPNQGTIVMEWDKDMTWDWFKSRYWDYGFSHWTPIIPGIDTP